MKFKIKNIKFAKLLSRSFIFLGFVFLFFVINSGFVLAADFKVDVGSVEWTINSNGIYKDAVKIACNDIWSGYVSEDGFLVKNSSGVKLFSISEDKIRASIIQYPFTSLTYPASISDSFILKKENNDILLYVDDDGLHYKEGLCTVCGNGNIESGEECDDGDTDNGDGCDSSCNIEDGWDCVNYPSPPAPSECQEQYDDDLACVTNVDCADNAPNSYCFDCICTDLPSPYPLTLGHCQPSNFTNPGCESNVECGSEPRYCNARCQCSSTWEDPNLLGYCTNPGGGTCFTGDTRIDTPNGYKYIKDIQTGDIVYSYNLETNQVVESEVGKRFKHEQSNDKLMLVSLSNGAAVEITDNHSTYSVLDGKYQEIKDFKINDWILYYNEQKQDFEIVLIRSIDQLILDEPVYSLHLINDPHNHTAGGILVHNALHGGGKIPVDPDAPNY
jgi:cysteine-rich repeat protein